MNRNQMECISMKGMGNNDHKLKKKKKMPTKIHEMIQIFRILRGQINY